MEWYKEEVEKLELYLKDHDKYTWEVTNENKELENEVNLLKHKLNSRIKDHNSRDEASEEENSDMKAKIEQLEEDVEIGYGMVQRKTLEKKKNH